MSEVYNPILNSRKHHSSGIDAVSSECNLLERDDIEENEITNSKLKSNKSLSSVGSDESLQVRSNRSHASRYRKYVTGHKKVFIGFCFCVGILICIPIIYLLGDIPSTCSYCEPTGMTTNPTTGIKITLFGDSLMTFPYQNFRLGNVIRSKIPYLNSHNQDLIFYDEGIGGNTIYDIAMRMDKVLSHNAQGLLLFWDTDCSDFQETDSTRAAMRANYQYYLQYVINKVS